ncbi:MAG: hypothetical protein WCG26_14475 [Chloroflexales bacterium]
MGVRHQGTALGDGQAQRQLQLRQCAILNVGVALANRGVPVANGAEDAIRRWLVTQAEERRGCAKLGGDGGENPVSSWPAFFSAAARLAMSVKRLSPFHGAMI